MFLTLLTRLDVRSGQLISFLVFLLLFFLFKTYYYCIWRPDQDGALRLARTEKSDDLSWSLTRLIFLAIHEFQHLSKYLVWQPIKHLMACRNFTCLSPFPTVSIFPEQSSSWLQRSWIDFWVKNTERCIALQQSWPNSLTPADFSHFFLFTQGNRQITKIRGMLAIIPGCPRQYTVAFPSFEEAY